MGFPRRRSLRSSVDIGKVIRNGETLLERPLKLHVLVTGNKEPNRLAFAVPRAGRTIVERNRLKRRLQEIARQRDLPGRGKLAVLRCDSRAYDCGFSYLRDCYDRLMDRIAVD